MRLYDYCYHNGQGYYDWYSVADQEFPGDRQPVGGWGGGNLLFGQNLSKTMKIEENWTGGGVCIQTLTV